MSSLREELISQLSFEFYRFIRLSELNDKQENERYELATDAILTTLKTAVLAVAPEEQVFTDIPEVDYTGKVIKVHKGETYTREMYFYNQAIADYTEALQQLFESEELNHE